MSGATAMDVVGKSAGLLDFITPGVGSAISAGAGLLGSLIGGNNTNAANAASVHQQAAYAQYAQQESERYNQEQRNAAQDFSSNEATVARNWQAERLDNAMGFSASEADKARAFNTAERNAAQEWQAGMANTAYQRSVADMRKAGLNPILGISSGGAATPSVGLLPSPSPSGVSGSASAPTSSGGSVGGWMPSAFRASNALGDSINSGIAAARTASDIQSIFQGMRQSQATTDRIEAETTNARANTANISADTAIKLLQPKVIEQQLVNLGLEPGKARALIESYTAGADASRAAAGASAANARLTTQETANAKQEGDYMDKYKRKMGTASSWGQFLDGAGDHLNDLNKEVQSGPSIGRWLSNAWDSVFKGSPATNATMPGGGVTVRPYNAR